MLNIILTGHIIRNEETQIAETVRKLHSQWILLLTGTPIQNNLHELYSLLNFLHPDIFVNSSKFDKCFDLSNHHIIDKKLLLKVHSMLKPFMLRRLKADVEKSVPPKVEKKILCPMTPMQSLWYKRFLLKESAVLMHMEHEYNAAIAAAAEANKEAIASDSASAVPQSRWRRLMALFIQLRKVCNHPFLFPEADPLPGATNDSIISSAGKLQVLDKILMQLAANKHRVVIFSQFTGVLDILSDYLNFRGYRFCRLDGSTNRVQRQVHINSFNAPNSPIFIFIMSTRAGGLGVNLQTADTVVLYDSDWNPQADLQAMARVVWNILRLQIYD